MTPFLSKSAHTALLACTVSAFCILVLANTETAYAQPSGRETADSTRQSVHDLSDDALRDSLLAAEQRQDNPAMVRFADVLLTRTPKATGVYILKARALLREDPRRAIKACNEAIALDDTQEAAYVARGIAHVRLEQYDQALSGLEEYLNRFPTSVPVRNQYARALREAGRYEEAVEEFEIILGKTPTYNYGRTALAETYYRMGEVEAALETAQRALDVDPDGVPENRMMFNILGREGRYAEALPYLHREIRIQESKGERADQLTYVNRAFYRAHFDSLDAARRDVKRAFAMQKEEDGWTPNAYAYRSRAIVRIKSGNVEGGCADLQRAMDLNYREQWGRWSRYGPDPSVLHDRHCTPASTSSSGN